MLVPMFVDVRIRIYRRYRNRNEVGVLVDAAFASPITRGHNRRVRRVQREVDKKRRVFFGAVADELDRLFGIRGSTSTASNFAPAGPLR